MKKIRTHNQALLIKEIRIPLIYINNELYLKHLNIYLSHDDILSHVIVFGSAKVQHNYVIMAAEFACHLSPTDACYVLGLWFLNRCYILYIAHKANGENGGHH